ncbi:MAG: hypothetical protein FWH33_03855, partial [Oscillospiraceae bacterium]|nr:hypothetical protein [Oscillospiraceae bacterium]
MKAGDADDIRLLWPALRSMTLFCLKHLSSFICRQISSRQRLRASTTLAWTWWGSIGSNTKNMSLLFTIFLIGRLIGLQNTYEVVYKDSV